MQCNQIHIWVSFRSLPEFCTYYLVIEPLDSSLKLFCNLSQAVVILRNRARYNSSACRQTCLSALKNAFIQLVFLNFHTFHYIKKAPLKTAGLDSLSLKWRFIIKVSVPTWPSSLPGSHQEDGISFLHIAMIQRIGWAEGTTTEVYLCLWQYWMLSLPTPNLSMTSGRPS